jgi:hypothetical protein
MRISRSILESRGITRKVSVGHLFKALSEQTQLPDCAWPSAMKTLNDVHDYLFGNITIAIVVPLAVEAVFVLRFIIARQWQSDCDHDGSRPTHINLLDIADRWSRGNSSRQADR